jgi:O-acetylserine/cysteine efflux transporter
MNLDRRTAVAALAAAGLLWGTTVPVTKLALEWLPPGWLTVARFGLAAAVLLAAVRFRVRAACSPAVLAWGALGYGGSILVQNAGITRTSVSHAALLVGATPVLVAVIAAVRHRRVARPVAWMGFAVSFVGVGLVAAGGGGATFTGDGLVLASLVVSASFTVAQARLLPGRDPVAVTAVQFLMAALATLPVAAVTEGTPAAAGGAGILLATVGLALAGTLAPFTLFAYGQARVSAESAVAFVNLEPLVGAAAGAVVFGDPAGMAQAAGGAAILTGIALSSLPLLLPRGPRGDPHTVMTTFPRACPSPRYRSASGSSLSACCRSMTGVTFPASRSSRRTTKSSRLNFATKKTTFWLARSGARRTLAM